MVRQEMVVAYVDVLGTRSRTIEECEKIYSIFHAGIKANEERQKNFPRAYSRKSWIFSDCAYLAYYQNGKREWVNSVEVLRPMLENLSMEVVKFLAEGFLVRGGIAVNEGYFRGDQIFCGRAFYDSAGLEENAKIPCVVVDQTIAELFLEEDRIIDPYNPTGIFADIFPDPDLILRSGGEYFLNVLHMFNGVAGSVGLDDRMVNQADLLTTIDQKSRLVIENLKMIESVKQKWQWIRKYAFESLNPFCESITPGLYDLWETSDVKDRERLFIEEKNNLFFPPNLNGIL